MNKIKSSSSFPSLITIALVEAILFTTLWLWNDYVATYLTLIFPGIFLFLLLLAGISDLIEPSRISGWYYGLMMVSVLVPLLIGALFYYLAGGQLDWLV